MSMSNALSRIQLHFPKVNRIVDAVKPIEVVVTKDDQKNGHVLDVAECAMAVACKRQFGLTGALIGLSTAYLVKSRTAFRYKTSAQVAREIVSFDRHNEFAVGTYRLTPPSASHRLGVRQGRPHGGVTRPAKGSPSNHFTSGIRRKVI